MDEFELELGYYTYGMVSSLIARGVLVTNSPPPYDKSIFKIRINKNNEHVKMLRERYAQREFFEHGGPHGEYGQERKRVLQEKMRDIWGPDWVDPFEAEQERKRKEVFEREAAKLYLKWKKNQERKRILHIVRKGDAQ